MTKQWLDIAETRSLLKPIVGFAPDSLVIHSAASNGKIESKLSEKPARAYHGNTKRRLFYRPDLIKYAEEFLRAKGSLLSTEEAYELFKQGLQDQAIDFADFTALIESQNIPPIDARLWQRNFFDAESVKVAARNMHNKNIQELLAEDELLDLPAARERLQTRLGRNIDESTLVRMIQRGKLTPASTFKEGTRRNQYRLRASSVDKLHVREYGVQHAEKLPVISVHDTEALKKLEEQHGPLIDTPTAVNIVRSKAGRQYDTVSAKRLIERNVQAVCKIGNVKMFPKQKVLDVIPSPLAGRPLAVNG